MAKSKASRKSKIAAKKARDKPAKSFKSKPTKFEKKGKMKGEWPTRIPGGGLTDEQISTLQEKRARQERSERPERIDGPEKPERIDWSKKSGQPHTYEKRATSKPKKGEKVVKKGKPSKYAGGKKPDYGCKTKYGREACIGGGPPQKMSPSSSQLTTSQKRDMIRDRKMSFDPHYEILLSCTAAWESLRRSSTPIEDRAGIVRDISRKLVGHALPIARRPTGSRIMQSMFAHGDLADLEPLFEEIKTAIPELAMSKYACRLVNEILFRSHTLQWEFKDTIIAALSTSWQKLLKHKYASRVVQQIYQNASPELAREILQNVFTRPSVDGVPIPPARDIWDEYTNLLEARPFSRTIGFKNIENTVIPAIEKGISRSSLLMDATIASMVAAGKSEVGFMRSLLDTLSQEGVLASIIDLPSGGALASTFVALGTPKMRKRAAQLARSHLPTMLEDFGWLVATEGDVRPVFRKRAPPPTHLSGLFIAPILALTDDIVMVRKILIRGDPMRAALPIALAKEAEAVAEEKHDAAYDEDALYGQFLRHSMAPKSMPPETLGDGLTAFVPRLLYSRFAPILGWLMAEPGDPRNHFDRYFASQLQDVRHVGAQLGGGPWLRPRGQPSVYPPLLGISLKTEEKRWREVCEDMVPPVLWVLGDAASLSSMFSTHCSYGATAAAALIAADNIATNLEKDPEAEASAPYSSAVIRTLILRVDQRLGALVEVMSSELVMKAPFNHSLVALMETAGRLVPSTSRRLFKHHLKSLPISEIVMGSNAFTLGAMIRGCSDKMRRIIYKKFPKDALLQAAREDESPEKTDVVSVGYLIGSIEGPKTAEDVPTAPEPPVEEEPKPEEDVDPAANPRAPTDEVEDTGSQGQKRKVRKTKKVRRTHPTTDLE